MLSKSDIDKLKAVFATKDDLKGLEMKFEDKVVSFKDEILTEIRNLRVDVTIVTGYRDMMEQHEVDIEAIKKHLKLPLQ